MSLQHPRLRLGKFLALACVVLGAAPVSTFGRILYVSSRAQPGGNGLSWETAFRYLQDALLAAGADYSVTEVRVARGVYRPDQSESGAVVAGDRAATFRLRSDLVVRGGFEGVRPQRVIDHDDLTSPLSDSAAASGPSEPVPQRTILSGDLLGNDGPNFAIRGDNSRHVVTAEGTGPGTRLMDVTIEAGAGGFVASPADVSGAGIFLRGGSLRVANCVVRDNQAAYGGGIYVEGPAATLALQDSIITGNRAYAWKSSPMYPVQFGMGGGLLAAGDCNVVAESTRFEANETHVSKGGGAAIAAGARARFDRAIFRSNKSHYYAADQRSRGGGVYVDNADAVFVDCLFADNESDSGAAAASWQATLDLFNCRFVGNQTSALGTCGGLYTYQSTTRVVNGLFTGNRAYFTAAMYFFGGVNEITNTTVVNNVSSYGTGGVFAHTSGQFLFENCMLWNNFRGTAHGEDAQVGRDMNAVVLSFDHSLVEGWSGVWGGVGNFSAEPLFVDASGPDGIAGTLDDDLRLQTGSPCIDAGNNAALPEDVFDVDADGDVSEPLPIDLAGTARRLDDPLTPDTGAGSPPVVDLGAFEFDAQN